MGRPKERTVDPDLFIPGSPSGGEPGTENPDGSHAIGEPGDEGKTGNTGETQGIPEGAGASEGTGDAKRDRKRGTYKLDAPESGSGSGTKTGGKKPKIPPSLTVLARQVQGAHLIISQMGGLPELVISEEEATAIAQVITDVSREYRIKLNSKYTVLIQAGLTLAVIYGPRGYAIGQRIKAQKSEQLARQKVAEKTVETREDRPVIFSPEPPPNNNGQVL